jgi:hypothetical protein
VSILLVLICTLVQPREVVCPRGWVANYATREGVVSCALEAYGDDAPSVTFTALVYCEADEVPMVRGRSASCRRYRVRAGNVYAI